MTAKVYGRRLHNFDVAQGIVELIRGCPDKQLTPEKFKAIVDALMLKADDFDKAGWWGFDCVADGLLEASGCLEDVRSPDAEKNAREEEQHQRELRAFMFEGYR